MSKKWIIGTALLFLFAFTFSLTASFQTANATNDPGDLAHICCIKYCTQAPTKPAYYGHWVKDPGPQWSCAWPTNGLFQPDCIYRQFVCPAL